jgi:presqualene diphosphate synthase
MLQTSKQELPAQNTGAASRAKGSSFYLAMRILPRAQREAMFEVYSFCKAVDDIADGDAARPRRLEQLADWRKRIAALYAGRVPDGLSALARAVAQYALRQEDFLTVIDGMEMDAVEDIRAPSFEQLDLYCDRVASAVGRLSVRVFGLDDRDGQPLAFHLGRALQLTNILRDIDEDAAVGRLYLPREALDRAGIEGDDPQFVILDPRLGVACEQVVERARDHFREADAVMAHCPRRQVRAPKLMEGAYRRMLEEMVQRGWAWPRNRVHVSRSHLLKIALRHAIL